MRDLFKVIFMVFCCSYLVHAQTIAQFRGPDRNGVFQETGLLKSWPESGPELLWTAEGLKHGYASVTVTERAVYVTGRKKNTEYLTVLDLSGKLLWSLPYGRAAKQSFNDTRCTPAVEGDYIYLISGRGEVVCINEKKKEVEWSVDAFDKFRGEHWYWEIAEQPLIVDDKIVFTPGGHKTSMTALNKLTGETIWMAETLDDTTAMASPALIEIGGKKIIVNVLVNFIIGVDAENGRILWKVKYSEIEPPDAHPWMPHNNCVMPLYHDGYLFVTSGYDHVGIMFKLLDGGNKIEQVWINRDLDNHHGQVVKAGNYIYGSNWIDNRNGNWCCVDWQTGETKYEKKWYTKGSISAADGMLYCYDAKSGNLALVKAEPNGFNVTGSFQITQGEGPHWAQPVIHNSVLFIRHGEFLMAYDISSR